MWLPPLYSNYLSVYLSVCLSFCLFINYLIDLSIFKIWFIYSLIICWFIYCINKFCSSHLGTRWEPQRCSPLEQSGRGVLEDNSRCPSGMLTLSHPVQLASREDHAGNTPWSPHIHLHWWKANMQPMICRRHRSYGRQQWWIQDLNNRLVDRATAVSTEKSKTMTNSRSNISADISTNGLGLVKVTSFKYLEAALCKNGTCSAEVRIRIASVVAGLNRIWRCKTINFTSKYKLYKSFVTSILLYGCDTYPACWLWQKGSRLLKPSAWGNFFVFPIWSTRPTSEWGARSTSV